MRRLPAFAVVSLLGCACTTANSAELSVGAPSATATRASSTAGANVTIKMTAATLAEDCGGGRTPYTAPVPGPAPDAKMRAGDASLTEAKRACQQTAMQLSVVAGTMKEPAQR